MAVPKYTAWPAFYFAAGYGGVGCRAILQYYYVDIELILAYMHFSILEWILIMAARRKQKMMTGMEGERLLQAKLPAHLVKALRILALEQDTTVKDLLNRLVANYVARRRRASGGKG